MWGTIQKVTKAKRVEVGVVKWQNSCKANMRPWVQIPVRLSPKNIRRLILSAFWFCDTENQTHITHSRQMLHHWAILSQARVRESSERLKNIWLNTAFQIDHALAQGPPLPGQEPPIPLPLIDYWMGITCFLPSHGLAYVLKARRGAQALSASRFHLHPLCSLLYFPYLYTQVSCRGFFHAGQRIWKSSDHRLN
jgi:hypothetical protein